MKERVCTRCKYKKPIKEFYKSNVHKGGYNTQCKKCIGISGRNKYKLNRKEILKRNKEWRLANPWYESERARKNPRKSWATGTLRNHRHRGFKVKISVDALVIIAKKAKICPLCRKKLDWSAGKGKTNDKSPTLDRINNENYMDENNSIIVCHRCNWSKGSRTLKEYLVYCKLMVKNIPELL